MKILYIHGYNGHPYGNSYHHLKKAIGDKHELFSIDYDVQHPKLSLDIIYKFIKDNKINVVIGSSLGGFLTLYLSGVSRIVVNPCCDPANELPKIGYNGPINEYKEILDNFKYFHDYEEYHLCSGCFTDNDEYLGTKYKDIFSKYFENTYIISDGHHITEKSANEIINKYLPHHIECVHDFCNKLNEMDNAPWIEK